MTKNLKDAVDSTLSQEVEKLKFSDHLASKIITVTVAKSKPLYLHYGLLVSESEKFSTQLNSAFKEAETSAIEVEDEDPELFGFFVEYIYRDHSILSREVRHYSNYVTLARIYAMGERLMAARLQAQCLWRFTQSLKTSTDISEECICALLQIACTEITERVKEDSMRSHIFWYAGYQIGKLQKSDMFRQLLYDTPDVGHQLCLWVQKSQPPKPAMPNELQDDRFKPESEYSMKRTVQSVPLATADE